MSWHTHGRAPNQNRRPKHCLANRDAMRAPSPSTRTPSRAGSSLLPGLLLLSSLLVMTLALACAGLGRVAWNGSQLSPIGIVLSLIVAGLAAPFALLSGVSLHSRRGGGTKVRAPRERTVGSAVSAILLVLLLLASLLVIALGLAYAAMANSSSNTSPFGEAAVVFGLLAAGIAAPFALLSSVVLYLRRQGPRTRNPSAGSSFDSSQT